MKAGRSLGVCLVAVLSTVSSRAGVVVSAQPQASVAGERTTARAATSESTADIMAREDDVDPSGHTSNLTVPASASFTAFHLSDVSSLPPDASGAAGPTQFIAVTNGRIRSFTKAGIADGVLNVKPLTFFSSVRGTGNPFGGRIRFDRLSNRWFITMATDAVPGRIVIASSNTATVTAATVWSFSSFDDTFLTADCTTDTPSLGIDASALYIGANQFCTAGTAFRGSSAWVVRKSSVLDGATPVVTAFHDLTGSAAGAGPFAPQGVNNDDAAAATGYILGVDNATLGVLTLRRVSNPGATPTLSGNISIPVASTALPIPVRHRGNTGGANGYLSANDDRLASVHMQAGRAWVAHSVGVTETGAAGATRNGVRWYEIGSLDTTPAVIQSGTLHATTAPGGLDERNYWNASIATSVQGRTVIGFSAAGTNEFANAGAADRFAADAPGTLRAPALFTASAAAYNPPADAGGATGRRWGGYSETVMDACDGTSIWTVQQFTDAADSYGVQVARIQPDAPPAPVSVSPASVAANLSSVDVVVAGTPATADSAYYNAPAGFACGIAASVAGLTVNRVTVNSPTSVTLNLSTMNAVGGAKPVTITNPDGQSVTAGGLLTVVGGAPAAAPFGVIDTPAANATVAGEMAVTGWALGEGGVQSVDVYRSAIAPEPAGLVLIGRATFVRGARPDLKTLYPTFADADSGGWGLMVLTNMLPNGGTGTYTIHAYATDALGSTTLLGTRQVTATNATSVLPFGTIDTPGQGATVSGVVVNFGWALTPQPKSIPTDGSTIDVYVDNVFVGHPVYNEFRADLASTFPGLKNTNGAAAHFILDTRTLSNGLHTIGWVVRDDAGQAAGIGSRYFRVQNGS